MARRRLSRLLTAACPGPRKGEFQHQAAAVCNRRTKTTAVTNRRSLFFSKPLLNICKVTVPAESVWMRFPIDPLSRRLAFAFPFLIVTAISARAAEPESADLRYFRELVETRNYS